MRSKLEAQYGLFFAHTRVLTLVSTGRDWCSSRICIWKNWYI